MSKCFPTVILGIFMEQMLTSVTVQRDSPDICVRCPSPTIYLTVSSRRVKALKSIKPKRRQDNLLRKEFLLIFSLWSLYNVILYSYL